MSPDDRHGRVFIRLFWNQLRTNPDLVGSAPENTADEAKAAASVRKLATLDVKAILPGHGNPLTTGAADALRKLAASLPAN
jgi:glyoxylase-like metal-dependent hydrolase (beta-lactamase superfamily II)